MDSSVYWLWLQQAFGYGARLAEPLRAFGGAKAFYEATENDYRASGVFGRTRSFSKTRLPCFLNKDLSAAERTLEACESFEISVLTPDDDAYPQRLRQLPDYPAALFVRGDIRCLENQVTVAVIGARAPTQYAFSAAQKIAGGLAAAGAVIVSGGALGIDSAAHTGALREGKDTVLVMGCGHFSNYLKENRQLREAVAQHGALVSEYAPSQEPHRGSFPLRNRLISGLSDALVIVEAAQQSGTLNTAHHAQQQGKPIFVLPGDGTSEAFAGSRTLLRSGAKAVFSAEDVAFHLGFSLQAQNEIAAAAGEPLFAGIDAPQEILSAAPRKKRTAKPKTEQSTAPLPAPAPPEKKTAFSPEGVSESAALVYNILQNGNSFFDEILSCAALPVPVVLSALTELELAGAVEKAAGNSYRLCE